MKYFSIFIIFILLFSINLFGQTYGQMKEIMEAYINDDITAHEVLKEIEACIIVEKLISNVAIDDDEVTIPEDFEVNTNCEIPEKDWNESYFMGAESYEKYRAETTIRYLLKFYDEYKQKCYQDSFEVKKIEYFENLGEKFIVAETQYWDRIKPTFQGFIEFLRKKIKEDK